MKGWIKIHRKMLNWEWFTEPKTLAVFLYLLLSAKRQQCSWKGYTIEAGQCVTTREQIIAATKLSAQEVRTSLERLKSTNEITSKSTNKFSIVTITNYVSYQVEDSDEQPTNQPATQPTNNQQITNKTKEKKDIKRENIIRREEERKNLSTKVESQKRKLTPQEYLTEKGIEIDDQLLKDYITLRTAKRAPVTPTVLNILIRESQKAGISVSEAITLQIEQGWQGFKAEWYNRLMSENGTNRPQNRKDNRRECGVSDFKDSSKLHF